MRAIMFGYQVALKHGDTIHHAIPMVLYSLKYDVGHSKLGKGRIVSIEYE